MRADAALPPPPIAAAYVEWSTDTARAYRWHPRVVAAHDHWLSLHPAPGVLPGLQHLDLRRLPDLLPGVWMFDVAREPFRFRYRYLGSRMVSTMEGGRDYTGWWLDEAHPNTASDPRVAERYVRVAEERRASWRAGRPAFRVDRDWVLVQNVVMPLAADGHVVDCLFCYSVLLNERGEEHRS